MIPRPLAALLLLAGSAAAAVPDPGPVYGCNMPGWWTDAYGPGPADASLKRLAGIGAGWVALTPTLYAADRRGSEITATEQTVSDASLRHAIRTARKAGLKVLLKPHLDMHTSMPRFTIRPSDPDRWFARYTEVMLGYARVAEEEHCEMLAVGTELALLASGADRDRWLKLIMAVRAVYKGPLTYAANSFDLPVVSFWDALDVIGVDAYYPVVDRGDDAMQRQWETWFAGVGAVSRLYRKPVVFTEFGIAAQKGANLRPWDWVLRGPIDLPVQLRYYRAMIQASRGKPWFRGFLCWDWSVNPNAGGPFDAGMTVQGKPVEAFLAEAFRIAAPPPAVPSPRKPKSKLLERARAAGPSGPF